MRAGLLGFGWRGGEGGGVVCIVWRGCTVLTVWSMCMRECGCVCVCSGGRGD